MRKSTESASSWKLILSAAKVLSKRYYIQSAYAISDQAKMEQEQRSLMLTGDFFKKIIIRKDAPAPYYNDDGGILVMSVYAMI